MSVSFECCVLSGRGLYVGLITRPEESYRLWCMSKFDREASTMGRPWPTGGCCARGEKNSCTDFRIILDYLLVYLLIHLLIYLNTGDREGYTVAIH
jgi:hypothetical protein